MGLGNDYNLAGQRKTTDAEAREHQETLYAKRVVNIPIDLQILFDYGNRTDEQPVYIGYAPKGHGTDEDNWLVFNYAYNGNDVITSRKTAYGIYDNRDSLTYT